MLDRRLVHLAAGVGLACVVLLGCGDDDETTTSDATTSTDGTTTSMDTDPSSTAPGEADGVPSATAVVEDGVLVVTYRFTNTTEAAVDVTAARSVASGSTSAPDPGSAYVTATPEGASSVVLVPFVVPEGVSVEVPADIFVTTVGPGEELTGRVEVAWPLEADTPYPAAGLEVPPEPEQVTFCLGVGPVGPGGEEVEVEGRTWRAVRMDETTAVSTCGTPVTVDT